MAAPLKPVPKLSGRRALTPTRKTASRRPAPGRGTPRAVLLAALVLTALAYSNSIGNDFLVNWDDDTYVLDNAYIKDLSPRGIRRLFTAFYSSNYHPLTGLSNALEYRIFGLDPRPFHTVNLLLHLLNTFLVFRLVRMLTGRAEAAGIVALFFGVHPMHVESVSWISERKDVLYSAFFLASLSSYVRYLQSSFRLRHWLAALALFVASLLSKSAAVALPPLLVAIDLYLDRRIDRKSIVEKVPFFALSLLFGAVALFSQASGGSTSVPIALSPLERFLVPCYAMTFYVVKFFWPAHLSAIHYFPAQTGESLPVPYYAAPSLVCALAAAVYAARGFRKPLLFGSSFFVITLLPVSQVIPFGNAVVAERYTYLPYIGLLIAVAAFYCALRDGRLGPSAARWKPRATAGLALCALVLAAATWERNRAWRNGLTLFSDAIEKNPAEFYAYYSRGCGRQKLGDDAGAIEDYTAAIRLRPVYVEAYNNRAFLYDRQRRYQEAVADYTELIRLVPKDESRYTSRGADRGMLGDYAGALSDFAEALRLNPRCDAAYFNRGVVKEKTGDYRGAIEDQNEAVRLRPAFAEAFYARANSRSYLGDPQGALADYSEAIRINPGYLEAYQNRAVARYQLRDFEGSMADCGEIIGKSPGWAPAYYYRGIAALEVGRRAQACDDWGRAASLGMAEAISTASQHCR